MSIYAHIFSREPWLSPTSMPLVHSKLEPSWPEGPSITHWSSAFHPLPTFCEPSFPTRYMVRNGQRALRMQAKLTQKIFVESDAQKEFPLPGKGNSINQGTEMEKECGLWESDEPELGGRISKSGNLQIVNTFSSLTPGKACGFLCKIMFSSA